MYYIQSGGTVLALPLSLTTVRKPYLSLCWHSSLRLRMSLTLSQKTPMKTGPLRPWSASSCVSKNSSMNTPPTPFLTSWLPTHATVTTAFQSISMQSKTWSGSVKQLLRLSAQQVQSPTIWRWLFCPLQAHEPFATFVTEKARWGYAGKFNKGIELERDAAPELPEGVLELFANQADNVFSIRWLAGLVYWGVCELFKILVLF